MIKIIRIVHTSDTHLGLTAFQKTAEDGSNLRECTIEENLLKAADVIVDADPDIAIHAGDLFHVVKPKTRSILAALKFLDTLADNGIQFVGIQGNHDMPKNLYTSSVFEILKKAHPEIIVAHSYRYEHESLNGVNMHLIPNMLCPEDYLKAASDARCYNKENRYSSTDPHVLVTHGMADTMPDKRLSSIAEFELTSEVLLESYDYIALGHYHGRCPVGSNAWYSGSSEYLTYGEASQQKGALIIEAECGTTRVSPLELPNSPMWDIGPVDCSTAAASDLPSMIEERMKVTGGRCDQMYRFTLDFGDSRILPVPEDSLKELREHVMDLQIVSRNTVTERMLIEQKSPQAINYIEEFGRFVSRRTDLPETLRARVSATGMKTLQKVIANRSEVRE